MTRPSRRGQLRPLASDYESGSAEGDGIAWDSGAYTGGGTLTVEESDGTPSVAPVDTVKFDATDFTVTDGSDGSVTVTADEPDAAAHIADSSDAHDASAISIVDSGGYFTGTDVEAALQELGLVGVGGGGVTVKDEGTPLATTATTLDFVGAGVTASGSGATKTITIPGGGGVSYPGSVEGLYQQFKADAITGKSNGDGLTEWRNSAPLTPGFDAIATGTPTYQTNVLNSLPVVRFGGSAYFRTISVPSWTYGWSFFIVFKLSSIANAYTGLVGDAAGSASGFFVKSNGKSALYASGASNYDGSGAITYGTTNWNYSGFVITGGTGGASRRNGASDGSYSHAGYPFDASTNPLLYLANESVSGRVFSGDIAEILIYSRPLNSTEITAVESYLSGKYAL